MLIGAGGLNLPTDVPANQYVTFKGGKASASRGVGLTIGEGLDLFEPDALRYALAANLPEQSDTDISIEEIERRINEELVATWGNLVNRVLSMINKNCEGQAPESGERNDLDQKVLSEVDATLIKTAEHLEKVEIRSALRAAMDGAGAINAYLNATEPWKVAKEDLERAKTILSTALEAINGIRVAFAPYLPFSTKILEEILGPVVSWERNQVPPGTPIPRPTPLFAKIETPSE